ncbi:hypothetical protein LCGC14_0411210 [marine sediment metagenome]|uniref:Uncharacterized protein n=1 Tax=marine sediment metagenome TaxID=412755 RepID=A0A0F9W2Y8_9ZZZZ
MELEFPLQGFHKGVRAGSQPEGTTPHIKNMRPVEPLGDRARGGQRPPVDKWSTILLSDSNTPSPIVEIVQVTVVS